MLLVGGKPAAPQAKPAVPPQPKPQAKATAVPPVQAKPATPTPPVKPAPAPAAAPKPAAPAFEPLPGMSESLSYKGTEYYNFSLYSFADLGGMKQSLRCPQPSKNK